MFLIWFLKLNYRILYSVLFLGVLHSSSVCFSQTTKANFNDSCTYAYEHKYQLENSLRLAHLRESPNASHLRYSDETQFIDVWKSDLTHYEGTITTYVCGYTGQIKSTAKHRPLSRFFYQKDSLTNDTAAIVYEQISHLKEIRPSSEIKEWRVMTDGGYYDLESATPRGYTCKSWGNPESQDSLQKEALIVIGVNNFLREILKLKERFYNFRDRLPPGHYSYGMIIMTKQKISRHQLFWWQLRRRKSRRNF